MYRLFNYLLITILLSLVFSSKYKLTAHNDANDIRNDNNDDNRMLTNNEPKDTNLNGHRDASFNFKRSPSGPVTSPLSPSPVNVDASVKLPSHALASSSSPSISPSSSTPISDQKSDDVGVDNKFYRTLCSTNRMQSCQNLSIDCLDCDYDYNCDFGEVKSVTCRVKEGIECQGPKQIHHNYTCAYCYQFPEKNYYCSPSFACRVNSRYLTDCNVKSHVLCLGNRSFQRYKICNFVSGYKWSTALLLSVTLGGFGIDRFYLGYWQEGIGKLFSFGGFGVWTLVDIILIATGYLKPADGSRYINDFSFS